MADTKNNTGAENFGDRNSGYGNSGDRNSGDWNSGYGNSGYRNSGYRNSGDRNSGDRNFGDRNSGDGNSGYGNSGDRNSGDWNSGDGNSGYGNSGWFNTDEPMARFFNKETTIKLSDFYDSDLCPSWGDFDLCKWIPEEEMIDEEKKADPQFFVRGGYLKKYEYKEAWKNFWEKTSQENKNKFLNLPNFDWNIFTSITGIELNDAKEDSKKQELLKKAEELIEKANQLKEQANNL